MDQRSADAEEQRQQILRHYEILDTPPEATFDRVVSIITAVFGTSIAAITLIDLHRSYYKSEVGFGITESPADENMCHAVLRQDGLLIITDSDLAPPEQVAPMVKKGVRFYAGAPLRSREGVIIGTVCTIDPLPREVSSEQRLVLSHLAETVMDELELRLTAKKVAEAEQELRRLNVQLERASRNKSEFLASMSHELRTPLNGILGASELLGQGLFGPLNPKQQEYVQDIHQSGNHLLSLIDDVLDLSRIEAGQMQFDPQPLDVTQFMEACVSLVRGSARAKSQELVLLPPDKALTIVADERAVTQVACNLLSNALKFTPEQGRILFKAERDGDCVTFVIDDQGPGIPPEFHGRIFEQFFRVASDREGTGLGLPLARHLVEAQGGSISIESDVGRGSRF
ncbi:MAG: histidine kinase dimerization/phospho-acceptor domain-containing protein, partial [Dehalococcoidia bacterium]